MLCHAPLDVIGHSDIERMGAAGDDVGVVEDFVHDLQVSSSGCIPVPSRVPGRCGRANDSTRRSFDYARCACFAQDDIRRVALKNREKAPHFVDSALKIPYSKILAQFRVCPSVCL